MLLMFRCSCRSTFSARARLCIEQTKWRSAVLSRKGNLQVSTHFQVPTCTKPSYLALLFHDDGGPLAAALADETILGGTDHDCQDADLYAR